MSNCYILKHDFTHSGDPERDAFHVPFQYSDRASTIFLNPKYKDKLPNVIYFQANFNLIPEFDYPLTDLNIPVISDQMLQVLKGVRAFESFEVPVVMFDDTFLGDRFNSDGSLKLEVKKVESYQALIIVNRESVFDFDNSEFTPSTIDPSKPGIISRIVLRKPENGFSPIFRIPETPSTLFISHAAKEALEAAEVKGCVFEEVEVS
ncbi:MAG: hypothetical protein ACK5MZ_08990 [Aestuariibaculum sp.]